MKTAKLGATIVLLLFVGATVGMLIAQEVSQPGTGLAADDGSPGIAEETITTATDSSSGESIPAASSAGEPSSTVDTANPGPEANEGDVGSSTALPVADTSCVIDAIYFHNTHRCWTCQKIEEDARAIVEVEFAAEVASGRLRWSAINMEEERQYVERYDLTQPTLVLVRTTGDEPSEWVALDETWTLVRYETRYAEYIVEGFRAFLDGCP